MTTPTEPDKTSINSWYMSHGYFWSKKEDGFVQDSRKRKVDEVAKIVIDKSKKVKVD